MHLSFYQIRNRSDDTKLEQIFVQVDLPSYNSRSSLLPNKHFLDYCTGLRGHSCSTFAIFSEKLIFLIPGVRNVIFSEKIASLLNE